MPQNANAQQVGLKYAHISNAGTTTVKSTPGLLGALNINSAASASTVTIYDGTVATGKVVAVITYGAADTLPANLPFGANGGAIMTTALTIVTTGSIDLTVAYQ